MGREVPRSGQVTVILILSLTRIDARVVTRIIMTNVTGNNQKWYVIGVSGVKILG